MDNQQSGEDKVQLQQSFETDERSSILKTISIGLGVIGIGLAIGIGGYFLGVKNNKTFVQDVRDEIAASSPTPLPTEVSTKEGDPTADWISYANDKDGYSIKYPTDWGSEKCPPGGTDNQIIYICSSEKFGNAIEPVSYYIWISKVTQLDNQWAYKQDSISGLAAFRTIDIPSRSGAESVFFKANDNSYISISFTPYDLQNPFTQQDRFYKTFNQILSTFRFSN